MTDDPAAHAAELRAQLAYHSQRYYVEDDPEIGDDITYSGTVAAALEGLILGLPGIAVSQQSRAGELDWSATGGYDFSYAAGFVARLVASLEDAPLPPVALQSSSRARDCCETAMPGRPRMSPSSAAATVPE